MDESMKKVKKSASAKKAAASVKDSGKVKIAAASPSMPKGKKGY